MIGWTIAIAGAAVVIGGAAALWVYGLRTWLEVLDCVRDEYDTHFPDTGGDGND